MVNLAVKGAITISETSKIYSLTKSTDPLNKPTQLAAGEEVLLKTLFSESDTVKLENKNHSLMAETIHLHNVSLKDDYHKIYFNSNSVWLLPGIITSIAAIVAVFLSVESSSGPDSLFMMLWLSGWTVGVVL